jgi:N-acetylmuramoyl-L-alanine amidase
VRFVILLFLFVHSSAVFPGNISVHDLRQWRAPDHTRLVFDLSGSLEHRLFTLSNPPRVVVDMDNAYLSGTLPEVDTSGPLLAAVRTGRQEGVLRIVLDLKAEAKPRTFLLTPAGQYGHRLVIDLFDLAQSGPSPVNTVRAPALNAVRRDFVVAIDAGHGGEDPGAIGRRYRTREKDVTLAIARELEKLVAETPGMRPVLIRDGDYYVELKERYEKANRLHADVFISIHADAVPSGRARGSSVFVVSERGASSAMARWLADKENAADLIGGVSLAKNDDHLFKTIADLSQSKSIEYSMVLATDLLDELDKAGPLHLRRTGQAGFAVLKSIKIPSVLVETAFISSPAEEKKLRTSAFQKRLARAIFNGVKRYMARPGVRGSGTVLAGHRETPSHFHVVQSGETLVGIANQYGVHVDVLRFANDLIENEPRAGKRLRIP